MHCSEDDSFKGAQLLSTYLACPNHSDRVVEVKCEVHDALCCLTCATVNHRECRSVSEIKQLATGYKSIGQAEKLKTRLEDINSCIEEIISGNDECQKDFESSNEEIPKQLEEIKSSLMRLYERIELSVKREVQRLQLEEEIAMGNRQEKWKLKLNAISELLKTLDATLELGSDSQVYVTVHKLKAIVKENEKALEEQGSAIQGKRMLIKVQEKLKRIVKASNIESLVCTETVQSQYQLPKTSAFSKSDAEEEAKITSDVIQETETEVQVIISS